MESELPTLEDQFFAFSKFRNSKSDGSTITLYQSDYWLRQANILEDRRLTMTDTGIIWHKYIFTHLTFVAWSAMLQELCETKGFDLDDVCVQLVSCGLPGTVHVFIPQYRLFFDTYKSKNALINVKTKEQFY
ncbi:tubulin polymerization-promoting protein homolog [Spodoptera frugiperda]|uniref:Tubulin polymerization-promoting protein homolog n=1 Tax=Spodoptera frugiperda TaxID=7108 RepID=A0A9R0E7P5_SPOFR|nr:tubulin polymerization-promoting protein homolog [Spodoptera frugiperda]